MIFEGSLSPIQKELEQEERRKEVEKGLSERLVLLNIIKHKEEIAVITETQKHKS